LIIDYYFRQIEHIYIKNQNKLSIINCE